MKDSHLPAYEDGTECSKTSAYKIQKAGNYPEESTQHLEHGVSLKSRIIKCYFGDETSTDEMERTCGMSGKEQRYTKWSCIYLAAP